MKAILTNFDFMQNFDLKNLPKQTPEHLKQTLVHI